ncbi:hypothetical protein L1887_28180 [Cichorium endivia]|nr:hypothetical protein L1887_28180 [Cichorium endivia]
MLEVAGSNRGCRLSGGGGVRESEINRRELMMQQLYARVCDFQKERERREPNLATGNRTICDDSGRMRRRHKKSVRLKMRRGRIHSDVCVHSDLASSGRDGCDGQAKNQGKLTATID